MHATENYSIARRDIKETFRHLHAAIQGFERLTLHQFDLAKGELESARAKSVVPTTKGEPSNKIAYSIKEVSNLVGISRSTLYVLIRKKELRTVKRGKRTLVLAPDFRSWVSSFCPSPHSGG